MDPPASAIGTLLLAGILISKRVKKVTLSKTKGKGYEGKTKSVDDVRACVEKYSSVYVYTAENMRNAPLKGIRAEWRDSRFFFGRTKQLAVALGRTTESEMRVGLSRVSEALLGREGGLLFTNRTREEGPLERMAHSIEPYLRKLGLPTKLDCGVVTLLKNHTVCTAGEKLSADQAKLLQLLDVKLAQFKVSLRAAWTDDTFDALGGDMQ
ncbi:hypothetical protein T492DRAFT_900566 [Pavlovales sp. CCMP2436]|nr:hypothetical protein T492DRAFT_900566 [Pavlovales sp. CCMP2436]